MPNLLAFAPPADRPVLRLRWPPDMDERERAAAFERVALPHLPAAFRLARWLARDPHDAEDVLQESYLRAFRYFGSFSGAETGSGGDTGSGADARTWLLSIVRNTFRTY